MCILPRSLFLAFQGDVNADSHSFVNSVLHGEIFLTHIPWWLHACMQHSFIPSSFCRNLCSKKHSLCIQRFHPYLHSRGASSQLRLLSVSSGFWPQCDMIWWYVLVWRNSKNHAGSQLMCDLGIWMINIVCRDHFVTLMDEPIPQDMWTIRSCIQHGRCHYVTST